MTERPPVGPGPVTETYGLRFPPAITHQWQVEGMLYLNAGLRDKAPRGGTVRDHFVNLLWCLYPKTILKWHHFLDDVVDAFLNEDRVVHIGPTSIGKSHMWAAVLDADWVVAPKITSTILGSTSLEALEERIFGCIKKLHKAANDANDGTLPGNVFKQPKGIFCDDGGNRTGIYCVGVKPGDTETEIQKHIGKHPPRFRVILDEPQGMPWAIIRAQVNAGSSGEYKFVAMGNPKSWADTLGRICEPQGGRKYVQDQMPKYWRSTWYGALVMFHDGRTNPSVTHPEGPEAGRREFPFMLSAARIEEVRDTEGEDSPDFWTMMIGFFPPGGLVKTVCSESEFITHGATDPVVHWQDTPVRYAGLDPAFAGVDRFLADVWEHGFDTMGNMVVRHAETIDIKLELSRGNIEQQSAEKVVEELKARSIPINNVAIDSTAAQSEFANWVEKVWGETGLWRVDYASRVSDLPVPSAPGARKEDGSPRTCRDEYKDRPTELYMSFAAFVTSGHLRNVPMEVVHQMSCRNIVERARPMQIEPKDDAYKTKIGGRSPDEADAAVICFDMLRQRFGIVPKGTDRSGRIPGMGGSWEKAVDQYHTGGTGYGEPIVTPKEILLATFNAPTMMPDEPIAGDW